VKSIDWAQLNPLSNNFKASADLDIGLG